MEMCTAQGHLVGMLDRDQRTAKLCCFDRLCAVFVKKYENLPEQTVRTRRNKTISHRSVPGRTSPHSSCKTRKNGHFWKSLHRLKHALIVGAYLSLLTFPSTSSAPTIQKSMSSRETAEPKWLNPCGMGGVNGAAPGHGIPDAQLINMIVRQAHIAEAKAKTFKEEFAEKKFNTNVAQLKLYYAPHDYEWLPTTKIPKKLDGAVDPEHLKSLEFKPTLLEVYVSLQKIAVGVEQMVWDEEDRNGPLKSSLIETENYLGSLLCEIHTAIIEKELTVEETVTRDIMKEELRKNLDNTGRNIRDWIIYRDYLNMLQYIIQVFDHFKANLPSSD
ncbi:hypothetical protein MTP99_014455 [Tenebrio molitor]|uniref:uncharacterized protein n=1 Tax=Tenebrio molitor TaxID=7067 RepID=UPI001C3C04AC|nr:hypothetical protein MTP99_014455 [Tenebrio molitor]CAH1372995.1 unnamed protein product [Tenebrio molitor]